MWRRSEVWLLAFLFCGACAVAPEATPSAPLRPPWELDGDVPPLPPPPPPPLPRSTHGPEVTFSQSGILSWGDGPVLFEPCGTDETWKVDLRASRALHAPFNDAAVTLGPDGKLLSALFVVIRGEVVVLRSEGNPAGYAGLARVDRVDEVRPLTPAGRAACR